MAGGLSMFGGQPVIYSGLGLQIIGAKGKTLADCVLFRETTIPIMHSRCRNSAGEQLLLTLTIHLTSCVSLIRCPIDRHSPSDDPHNLIRTTNV